jgi:hypothetical protein
MNSSTLAETIERLLAAGDRSEVARAARSGLVGWWAILAAAMDQYPDDPEQASARELLARLDELLGQEPPAGESGSGPAAGPAAVPGRGADPALTGLVTAFSSDLAVERWLDEQALAGLAAAAGDGSDPGAAWRALRLCLLRLPEHEAQRWLTAAPGAGAPPGFGAVPVAVPDEAVLGALGLRSATGDAAGDATEDATGDADAVELAGLGSLLLALTEQDENLVLCLESVLFKGSRRLDDELRRQYRTDLLGRLREYTRSAPGSPARLEAVLDIDEAVASLTHRPPAAGGSWWAGVRARSRRLADRSAAALRAAGTDAEVMEISLRYLDVKDLTAGNDVGARSGGEPGDVLACLRLWAKISGKTLPGRVMYRA